MRIFDPKNQFGNSLLSQADTTKSSIKMEKQMVEGEGAITLTSTDISDIENWELSTARVEVDGQMVSFLPDTSRGANGDLTVDFGTYFPNAVLILKRTVFDGMKQEEEEITIEVEIRQLMAKTLATAGKDGYDAAVNVQEWQELGGRAFDEDNEKYRAAKITYWDNNEPPFVLGTTVEDSFLSLQSASLNAFGLLGAKVRQWRSDLPALQAQNTLFAAGPLEDFDGKMPNLVDGTIMFWGCRQLTTFKSEMPSLQNASYMFQNCSGLASWSVELLNSLTNAKYMFSSCSSLTSWNIALPNSITNAEGMFGHCSGLTEWTVELPNNLTNASYMFIDCTSLTTWTVALPDSITNASYMFYGCTGLTSFNAAMPNSLTDASGMFSGCKLNKASVQKITDTIPTVSDSQSITIGIDSTQITQDEQNAFNTTITGKGWTVTWERN